MTAYCEMMPRLAAEEALDAASAVALGSGTLQPMDAHLLESRLRRRAAGSGAVPVDPRALAMIGIAVEVADGDR